MADPSWKTSGFPFKGKKIDAKGNQICKGDLLVLSHEIQFISVKKKLYKDEYPFKSIKSYGCHDNVLSIQVCGEKEETVHFKLKEAIVVKDIMDKVVRDKRRPQIRMPSFDGSFARGGFYDMQGSAQSRPGPSVGELGRSKSLQENSMYSRAKPQRSLSLTSSSSECSGSTSSDTLLLPGGSTAEYTKVETVSDPFSPAPNSPQKRYVFPLPKARPRVGYKELDMGVMEALREASISDDASLK